MKNICPYDEKIICAYLEDRKSGTYPCATCKNYIYHPDMPEAVRLERKSVLKAVLFIFSAIIVVGFILWGLSKLIHLLRL